MQSGCFHGGSLFFIYLEIRFGFLPNFLYSVGNQFYQIMKDRAYYIERFSAKLKEWDADISKLEAKTEKATASLKSEYRKQMDELKQKREEARTKLNEIKEDNKGNWETIKEGYQKSWDALESSVNYLLNKMR